MECKCSSAIRLLKGVEATRYSRDHLTEMWTDPVNWRSGFSCPESEQLWIMDFPNAELQGGGPARLQLVSKAEWEDQSPAWLHLMKLVSALVASGNSVAGSGFTTNQGGWDCQMTGRLDLDVLAPLIAADGHDIRITPGEDRIDCLHCWAGISGPG